MKLCEIAAKASVMAERRQQSALAQKAFKNVVGGQPDALSIRDSGEFVPLKTAMPEENYAIVLAAIRTGLDAEADRVEREIRDFEGQMP